MSCCVFNTDSQATHLNYLLPNQVAVGVLTMLQIHQKEVQQLQDQRHACQETCGLLSFCVFTLLRSLDELGLKDEVV